MRTVLGQHPRSLPLCALASESSERGFCSSAAKAAGAALLLVAIMLLTSQIQAQSTETRVQFEVASVTPSPDHRPINSMSLYGVRWVARRARNGRFTLQNVTLLGLIAAAYDVNDFQIAGGPSWMNYDEYEVIAKAEDRATFGQMKPMLQSLLADRFKLAFHRETRELPVYRLVVAKRGLKIVPAKEGGCAALDPDGPRLPWGTKVCGGIVRRGSYELTGSGITMPELIETLQDIVGRTVIDRTGVRGRFDIDLKFDPCTTANGLGEASTSSSAAACAEFSSYPSIAGGLQEQLGLQLQSAKGPVEVLVVDHAERGTAN
jgi:uncharacterized protein (TIGR03435 family)